MGKRIKNILISIYKYIKETKREKQESIIGWNRERGMQEEGYNREAEIVQRTCSGLPDGILGHNRVRA